MCCLQKIIEVRNYSKFINISHIQIIALIESKMSKQHLNENLSNILKTKAQGLTLLTKENILIKHCRKIKTSFVDLTPYLSEQFGFIDPDFPHVYTSINQNQLPPNEGVEWLPAEQIHPNPNYSDLINNLQTNLFHKKSISFALIIINWFQNNIFKDIFLNQLSSFHLYQFDVMIDGVFMHLPIDSYVPFDPNTKRQIFTPNYKGSVFPCLYQKLLAKIYGDYESITSQFIDIVELQTMYCRQTVSLVGEVKQKDILSVINQKLSQKSIVSFRTRNSIRLQSFGLESNYIYIILRIIQKQKEPMIQFLQLDGQNWIGKHSKLRSGWLLQEQIIEQKQIIRGQEYKENYMSLSDMKGIGRQLVILNNTIDFHKNYFVCQNSQSHFNMYRLLFTEKNKIMIRINFKQKKCYNAIYLIQKRQKYRLMKSAFNQNKQSNYIQYQVIPGQYFVIVYNTHPQQQILPYNLTLFSPNQFVQIQYINNNYETLQVLQNAFLEYFSEIHKVSKQFLFFRQLYPSTGLSFIYVKSPPHPLSITINNQMLIDRKILCVNFNPIQKQFTAEFPQQKLNLIVFRCLWSKKQNIDFDHQNISSRQEVQKIVFPPIGSVRVTQKVTK